MSRGVKSDLESITFSTLYEIAAVRPLRETSLKEREETLKKAHYNTELVPQDMVYIDLKSDSGVSSLMTSQSAAMMEVRGLEGLPELAREAHGGLDSLSTQFQELFGYPFVVPCTQGRAAEKIWTKIHITGGTVVPGNMLFPSTRFHIESNGGRLIDVISEQAYDLFSNDPFKGNVDVGKLEAVVREAGPQKVPCVYVELCVNSCGGHPVSLSNLNEVKTLLQGHGIPLFLDASRILENSYLIQQREAGYRDRPIREIVRETCSYADACTLSAMKDFFARQGGFIGTRDEKSYQRAYIQGFLDGTQLSSPALVALEVSLHELSSNDRYTAGRVEQVTYLWKKLAEAGVPVLRPPGGHGVFIDAKKFLPALSAESHPAEALAAFVYSISGIRVTPGPPLTQDQTARGIDLLRLALPAHRYTQGHMDDVAQAFRLAFVHRNRISGLKKIENAARARFDPPLFTRESQQKNQEPAFRHLGEIFFNRVKELGARPFLKLQRANRLEEISWKDFGSKVRETILGLYSLGLQKGDRIGILSENRLEWLCADAATMAGGLPNVVVSPRLSDGMIRKILQHSGARAVFIEDENGLSRLGKLKGQLPSLDHIIVMEQTNSLPPGSITYDDLLSRGRTGDESRIQAILESVRPDDLATIMYTSGSTGEPKGVMRTQENMLSNIMGGTQILPSKPDELFLVVLSLNHLLGRYGFQKSMVTGRRIAIVEATELEVDLKVIQALSPTVLTLVPRVMVKNWETLLANGNNRQHWEAIEALDQVKASRGSLNGDEDQQYEAMRASLRDSVKSLLGGRIQYITHSGAPMPPRIIHFFEVIKIPLLGSYGTTECGGVTLSGLGEPRPGSSGKPFPNVEVRIAEDGEILVRGPSVFPGYFGDPAATREVLDPDGWCHTGDLGTLDSDGFLYVVGRKKDIFYCSDGSNIYPGFIEVLLEQDPFIRQAALLGDRRPFIAALIVPDRGRIAAELNQGESTLTDDEIKRTLWSRVQTINERLEHYEQIRKFSVLNGDFPQKVRTVTAFQKIKMDRKEIGEHYQREIEKVYDHPFKERTDP